MTTPTPVTLVGDLTAGPELTYTNTGEAVAVFTIASTERILDSTGKWCDSPSLSLRCVAQHDLAENVAASLTVGSRVVVTGRLRGTFETTEGQKRRVTVLAVADIGASLLFATVEITATTPRGHVATSTDAARGDVDDAVSSDG